MALLAAHAWSYRHFMVDDAFISLRYADRFVRGLGLTWNDGEVVEGYSNLLWILCCSLLGKLGMNLVVAARVLGFAGSAGAIAAIVWAERGPTIRQAFPGLVGALALAASGSIAIWTVGGLEQPLVACLLAWALALSFPLLEEARPATKSLLGPGLLLGLIAVSRPDGLVFTFAACAGIFAARGFDRETWRSALLLALFPLLLFAAQLAFRLAYYHEWVPNSAFAKVSFTPQRIGTGLEYVGGIVYLAGLLIPAILAFRIAGTDPGRRRAVFLGVILVLWLAYVAAIGGDFFPGRRHLVPAVVVLAYLAALAARSWLKKVKRSLASTARIGALCFIVLVTLQILDPRNVLARAEVWVWDGEVIGGFLAKTFGDRKPLLAVDPAGCVPYFSRLPSIDMLGINDHYLAHHRPKDFGEGTVGHELGSGEYVLSRKPDLVLFNLPTGNVRPYFRSGREMVFDPRSPFRTTFRPVNFECEEPRHLVSTIWIRLDGALGIRRSVDRIQIPGFLFSGNPSSTARFDPEGRLGVMVYPAVPAGIIVSLPDGRWEIRAEGSGGGVLLSAWGRDPARSVSGPAGLIVDVAEGERSMTTIAVETQTPGGAHVREIVLLRR